MSLDHTGTRLYVPEFNRVGIFDSATGTRLLISLTKTSPRRRESASGHSSISIGMAWMGVDETRLGTDPNDPDTDDDGLLDGLRASIWVQPAHPREQTQDPDADGLDNLGEQQARTDPTDPIPTTMGSPTVKKSTSPEPTLVTPTPTTTESSIQMTTAQPARIQTRPTTFARMESAMPAMTRTMTTCSTPRTTAWTRRTRIKRTPTETWPVTRATPIPTMRWTCSRSARFRPQGGTDIGDVSGSSTNDTGTYWISSPAFG